MEILVDLIYSVFFMGAGFAMIKYRRDVKSWTGNFVWAEVYIGRGGTYTIMILVALFLIFLGVLYPFGGLDLLTGTNSSAIDTQFTPE